MAKISKKNNLTKNVREIQLSMDYPLEFKAGQFLMFKVPTPTGFVERAYSIASPPTQNQSLLFCYKALDGGVSTQFLDQAPHGTQIELRGPLGQFTIDDSLEPLILVATGTGMAPYRSMLLEYLDERRGQREIHLIFGVRSIQDIFWRDFLDGLAVAHKNFSYEITLSAPDESWSGLCGRVTDHLLPEIKRGIKTFYLCGSSAMVKDVRAKLINVGVAPTNIHFEIFS
ncbi:MAG: putative FMN reductase [Candidatus Magasanikbacteria bacterium]|nr:putative FMN reductase [Candidatus Magasanikbacteria bacterium]